MCSAALCGGAASLWRGLRWGSKANYAVSEISGKGLSVPGISYSEGMLEQKNQKDIFSPTDLGVWKRLRVILSVMMW